MERKKGKEARKGRVEVQAVEAVAQRDDVVAVEKEPGRVRARKGRVEAQAVEEAAQRDDAVAHPTTTTFPRVEAPQREGDRQEVLMAVESPT